MFGFTRKSNNKSSTRVQRPSKSLESRLPTAESKTPEAEEQVNYYNGNKNNNTKKSVNNNNKSKIITKSYQKKRFNVSNESEEKSEEKEIIIKKNIRINKTSPLSSRALKIKNMLKKTDIVTAVLLKYDGKLEEIKYDTTSKSINKILGGRPTIIGELEDIQVIIVRTINSRIKKLNNHILPVPFCNNSYNGDYLLYRIDLNGNSKNFTLNEYKKYIQRTSKLTEQARKNYNPIENKEIKVNNINRGNNQSSLVFFYLYIYFVYIFCIFFKKNKKLF